jgi:hypothetical protein
MTVVSVTAQMSLVLHYVTDAGIKERFVSFTDVSGGKRADDIAALIIRFLEEHQCLDIVVAQCYDGAAVMASGINGVQAKVKERAPIALFLHCRAHRLNLVLTQGASKLKESFLASSMAWLHFSPDPLSARNYWTIFASSASSSCGSNAVAMHIEIGQHSV